MISEQQRQKHQVARVFVSILFALVAIHLVDDYVARRWDEVGLNMAQLVLVAAMAYYIQPQRMRPIVHWAFATAVLVVPLYVMAKGAGDGTAIFYLIVVPPVAIYFLGLRGGTLFSTGALAAISALLLIDPFTYSYPYDSLLRFFLGFIVLGILTGALEKARADYARRLEARTAELVAERQALEAAQRDIKVLSGLLPICSSCKQIRVDDAGVWEDIEHFVAEHSDADFSHTVCPTCSERLYPEIRHG